MWRAIGVGSAYPLGNPICRACLQSACQIQPGDLVFQDNHPRHGIVPGRLSEGSGHRHGDARWATDLEACLLGVLASVPPPFLFHFWGFGRACLSSCSGLTQVGVMGGVFYPGMQAYNQPLLCFVFTCIVLCGRRMPSSLLSETTLCFGDTWPIRKSRGNRRDFAAIFLLRPCSWCCLPPQTVSSHGDAQKRGSPGLWDFTGWINFHSRLVKDTVILNRTAWRDDPPPHSQHVTTPTCFFSYIFVKCYICVSVVYLLLRCVSLVYFPWNLLFWL